MVGVRGFEPPTPASRRQCSTKLSYTPLPMYICISCVKITGSVSDATPKLPARKKISIP